MQRETKDLQDLSDLLANMDLLGIKEKLECLEDLAVLA